MTADTPEARTLGDHNRMDAEEFCKGAFGPFVTDVSQYVDIVAELMDHATERALKAWNTRSQPGMAREGGWQPIETAPTTGKPVLGYSTEGVSYVCWHRAGTWIFFRNYKGDEWSFEPTHWQPLPAGPALTSSDQGGK